MQQPNDPRAQENAMRIEAERRRVQTDPDPDPIWEPMPGKIAVEPQEAEDRYGSIILPFSGREQRTVGIVVATYKPYMDGGIEIHPHVEVGQTIVFGKYTGSEVVVNRRKVIILREVDILSKVHFPEEPKIHG